MTKEQKREYNRALAKAHPERRREINRQYRRRNAAKLKARRKQAWGALTDEERRAKSKHNYAVYKKRVEANPEYAARRRKANLESAKRYAATHKEQIAARAKAYRAKNRERLNEYCRKLRAKNRERDRQNQKRWREAHRDEYLRRKRERRAANIEAAKASDRRAEARRKKRKQTDAAYYHKRLAAARITKAKARILKGKMYHPRFNLRFPEWATMGVFDPRSTFLAENITPEMRAYARGLAIERRAAR